MKHWTTAILTAAMLAGTGVALAQGPGHHGGCHHGAQRGQYMQRMLDDVKATDAQKQKIKGIVESGKPQMKADMKAIFTARKALHSLDPTASDYEKQVANLAGQLAEATRKATINRAATRKQIAAVLTPEQRATLKKQREARMQKRQERMQKFREKHAGQQDAD